MGSFEPYKAPGVDGIYPKTLKGAIPHIKEAAFEMMRASLELELA